MAVNRVLMSLILTVSLTVLYLISSGDLSLSHSGVKVYVITEFLLITKIRRHLIAFQQFKRYIRRIHFIDQVMVERGGCEGNL